MSILEVKNLKKYYDQKLALDIANLEFEPKKLHVVVGPNGSGKTTLLKTKGGD